VPESESDVGLESIYSSVCDEMKSKEKVIMQNTQIMAHNDELFNTSALLRDVVEVSTMIDSGSMALHVELNGGATPRCAEE
jgi:hypothetical protein